MIRTTRSMLLAGCALSLARLAWAMDVSVIGGLTREATVTVGGKTEGKILVRNNTQKPLQAKAYQTDYRFFADGRNLYDEPGSVDRSNARWITFSPQQLDLPPLETVSISYVVQVPPDEKLIGTYWSMLMVEPLTETSPEIAGPADRPTVAIRTVMRYGLQIVTQIGDTGERKVEFAARRVVQNEQQRVLRVEVANTGQRLLVPQVWTELFDPSGASVGRFEGQRTRLYPGCSARFEMDLTQVPAGRYSALTVADNGDENVFGAQWKLEIR